MLSRATKAEAIINECCLRDSPDFFGALRRQIRGRGVSRRSLATTLERPVPNLVFLARTPCSAQPGSGPPRTPGSPSTHDARYTFSFDFLPSGLSSLAVTSAFSPHARTVTAGLSFSCLTKTRRPRYGSQRAARAGRAGRAAGRAAGPASAAGADPPPGRAGECAPAAWAWLRCRRGKANGLFAQMRARRLAKLGASASSSAPESSKTAGGAVATGAAVKPVDDRKENVQKQEPETRPNITVKRAQQPPSAGADGDLATAASGIPGNSKKRRASASEIDLAFPASPSAATPPPARRPHAESLEEWMDHTLTSAFRVSVDPSRTKDRLGHPLKFLPVLNQDLQDRGDALMLSIDDLDSAILEAGTAFQPKKPLLDYFLPCWKSVMRAIKQLRDVRPEKAAALQEAKRLCMSNAIFALTMPEYFGYVGYGICSRVGLD